MAKKHAVENPLEDLQEHAVENQRSQSGSKELSLSNRSKASASWRKTNINCKKKYTGNVIKGVRNLFDTLLLVDLSFPDNYQYILIVYYLRYSMKQTKERMINVEVSIVCSNCDGHGATCDNGCSATDPNCQHRRKDSCNCNDGMDTRGIWIPESVITEWRERQHEIEDDGNWNGISDWDKVANNDNVHTWTDIPAIDVE